MIGYSSLPINLFHFLLFDTKHVRILFLPFIPYRTHSSGSPLMNSPNHIPKYDGIIFNSTTNGANPIAINSVSSSNTNMKIMEPSILSPSAVQHQSSVENEDFPNTNAFLSAIKINKDTTPAHLAQWLTTNRLNQHANTFASFSGSDLLRMSKDDLIQICGVADGIRMYNTLHTK